MSPRPLAGSRLRRVLALVPWIAEHPGAALEEIAARFGVSEAELEHDLELLPLCGLPPYTPDRLIEVEIVDGHVWIRFAEYFDRPLRLSAEEGLGLLTAGRALLAVPGSDEHGALARALDKLASALGAAEGLAVEVGEPAHLDALRRAAGAHERVEIDYYSFGRDATTTRQIDLRSVFHAFGHWYAAAYCHQAEGERLFRLDRIRAVRPTGERFDPAAGEEPDFGESVYHPRTDDPRVTLELDPERDVGGGELPRRGGRGAAGRIVAGGPGRQRAGLARASAARPGPGGTGRGARRAPNGRGRSGRSTPDPLPRLTPPRARMFASGAGCVTELDPGAVDTTAPHFESQTVEGQARSEPGGRSKRSDKGRKTRRTIIEWTILIGSALVIAILIKTFLFQAFYIPSESMKPTLNVGDRVLVNKVSYRLHDVNRGDIVVFETPPKAKDANGEIKDLVKRVIALPGESFSTHNGSVSDQRAATQGAVPAKGRADVCAELGSGVLERGR